MHAAWLGRGRVFIFHRLKMVPQCLVLVDDVNIRITRVDQKPPTAAHFHTVSPSLVHDVEGAMAGCLGNGCTTNHKSDNADSYEFPMISPPVVMAH